MSYAVDVYRGQLKAVRRYPDYLLYVTFFPQLVAGPIERATHFLPQILYPRRVTWEKAHAALPLLAWGYFKKVVVADNLSPVADEVFTRYFQHAGADIVIGALAFTGQIYCDFSGYSDIARGLARLLGFELMRNFNQPYFAESPSDFWARWHISLSSWLRDYLYIPLGGNRGGDRRTYRNLALTMLLGGLWHGAAWNYVLWGAYHGALLILYRLWDASAPTRASRPAGGAGRGLAALAPRVAVMFFFTVVGWVLFRARTWTQIAFMLTHAGTAASPRTAELAWSLAFYAAPLALVESVQFGLRRRGFDAAAGLGPWARAPAYAAVLIALAIFGVRTSKEFIYFQF